MFCLLCLCVLCFVFCVCVVFCVLVVYVVCVTVCVPSAGPPPLGILSLHLLLPEPPKCPSSVLTHTRSSQDPDAGPAIFFSMWVPCRNLSRKCLASFRFKTEAAAETCRTKQRRAPSGDCSWTTEKNSKSQRSKVLHSSYAKRRMGSALANRSWMA